MSYLHRNHIFVGELSAREMRCDKPLVQTLSGTFTVLQDMPSVMSFDCNGAGRNCDMPAVTAQGMEGKLWFINNNTAATHALTVRDAAAATIQAIPATKSAIIAVCGGVWRVLSLVA